MQKTIYLYQVSNNFRFDREYLCTTTKQYSDKYIGELNIPIDDNFVSFAHLIYQDKNNKVTKNEIYITNRDIFLNNNLPIVFKDNNEYYQRKYGKFKKENEEIETIDVKILNHLNRNNDAKIYYLKPLKHCCIGGQPIFYNYVENLPIEDKIISLYELQKRLLIGIPESIEIKTMSLEISSDPYNSFRGHNCNTTIDEIYIPIWNISINNYGCNNILFNRQYKHDRSEHTSYTQREAIESSSEIILDDKLKKMYNLILAYVNYQIASEEF